MTTRAEHLKWCKDRAIKLANQDNIEEAISSMFYDIEKHPETEGHIAVELGTMLMLGGHLSTKAEVIKFIEDFN